MKLKHLFLAAALAVAGAQAHAEGFSDNSVGLRYGADFKEPGVASSANGKPDMKGDDIHKFILNLGHFDVWDYGSNFINIDALFSDHRDPVSDSTNVGATEVYGVYRGQLSPDKIFGISTKFGPIQAVNLELGGDFNTKNTQFAPNKKLIVFGPNFHFNVPAGFLNLGVHLSHEWNYNGFGGGCTASGCVGKAADFNTTPELEAVWLFPLTFTGLPLDFRGFANVIFPKGNGGIKGNTNVMEVLARPQLQLDVGKMLFNKSHLPDLYFAFEYWLNKFGNDHNVVPGSYAYTPMVGIEVHF